MTAMLLKNGKKPIPSGISGTGKITTISNDEYKVNGQTTATVKISIDGEGWGLRETKMPNQVYILVCGAKGQSVTTKGYGQQQTATLTETLYSHLFVVSALSKTFYQTLETYALSDPSYVGDSKTYGPYFQPK